MIDTAGNGLFEHRRAAVKTAVIILFHGSRADGSGEAAQTIATGVRKHGICDIVITAFLQRAEPDLMAAVRDCVIQHADRIVVVPFFLQMGMHVTEDIPSLLNEVKERYPGLQIGVTDAVGSHPLMSNIVADLVDKNMHRDNF
jgi:sirohydrochlorin ferrochelatase